MTDDVSYSKSGSLLVPTRRELLLTGGVALAGTALSGFMPWQAARAEEPKKGGNLRLGLQGGSTSDTFDPTAINDTVPILLSLTVMNGLVEYDDDGNPTGELLESWEANEGATDWNFKVRQGVTFSNGKTLDADDIIYSIRLHTNEESKSAAKSQLADITEIKAISPNEVFVKLSAGNADFPVLLGDFHLVVVPNGHTDWEKPIGTGAYVLEEFDPGVRVFFKSRGDYWKPGRGNFETVEVLYIADAAARTAALQSGEIQGANRLDPRTVDLLMKAPNLQVVHSKATGMRYCFVARCNDKPTNSQDLRLALKYGIDRELICKSVYNGYATPGHDHLLDAGNPFFNSELPQHTYDPDKAAFHFKKSGFQASDLLELKVSDEAVATSVDAAQIYQQNLKAAGIDLKVTKVSGDGYWDNVWLKTPFCAVQWARRMSTDQTLSISYGSKSDWNDGDWRNPDFEQLMAQARVELDPGARKTIYDECQRMIAEDAGHVVFAITDTLDGYSANMRGVKPHPRFDLADCRVAEKGWFA
jgi:peptide/nickel transport system substrate-binding protein